MQINSAIIIHHLGHISAALSAGEKFGEQVVIQTAFEDLMVMGIDYLYTMELEVRAQHPNSHYIFVIDCADNLEMAMKAIKTGFHTIRYVGERSAKLQELSKISRTSIIFYDYPVMDLLFERNSLKACLDWISSARKKNVISHDKKSLLGDNGLETGNHHQDGNNKTQESKKNELYYTS